MQRTLVPADLYRVTVAADPLAVADGGAIARVETFDRERDAIVGTLWQLHPGGGRTQLTGGPNDRDAALSPDGALLAYVAGCAPARIMLLALHDRNAGSNVLGTPRDGIADLVWSPSGDRIAFTAPVGAEAAATIAVDPCSGARHIVAFPYKDDARGLLDGTHRVCHITDRASGEVRRIVAPATDAGAPAWSPDGHRLAFAARVADASGNRASCSAVYVANADGTGAARALTAGDGPAYRPVFSPDGASLAYAGHRHGNDNRFNLEVFIVAAAGGEPRSLSAAADCAVGNALCGDVRSGREPRVAWTADGAAVLTLVTAGGACRVESFARDGARRTPAGGERDISGFARGPAGSLLIAYATPREPGAVASIAADGNEITWTFNPWLAETMLAVPQRIDARAEDGMPLDAWAIAPPECDGTIVPLVLDVHPGPHAAFGWTFTLGHQILAGCGIGVVYGNPRGSLGYGNAFARAATGDWGGADARDLLAMVDAALGTGRFDARRVGCIGQSYGGFMTTWLLGHTTRFAAGVSADAVNDFAALYATSDVGWTMESELAADVAADAGRALFERSALRAARDIAAPLLIVHGERDYRCPVDQAEALFNTLRYAGKRNVEFVRFADAGHELSRSGRPHDRVLRMRAITRWLLRHLCPQPPAENASGAGALFRPLPGE